MDVMLDQFKRKPTQPINQFSTGINFEQNKKWSLVHNSVLKPLSSEGRLIWDIKPDEYPTKVMKRQELGY